METCKLFYKLVAIFIILLFFDYFNAKCLIKPKTNISNYVYSEILSKKKDLE